MPGAELPGVFRLKRLADAEAIYQAARRAQRAVIVGAGPIGIEMAEALRSRGLQVALIEAEGHVLPGLLDFEMARLLERQLEVRGVEVRCGAKLLSLEGNSHLERVVAETETFEADLALLATGVRPNVELAREAGLALGETGAVLVDDHLRTSDPDIFAGGDCVESRHRISGRPVYVPLGTVANKHGRIIGDNLCGAQEAFPGVMGTTLLKAFDYTVGRSGLTSAQAQELGLETCEALLPAPDRAHYYGGARRFALKLICQRPAGRILGVQMVGPGEVARRLDAAVAAMSLGASAAQLSQLDFGYSPPYSLAMDLLITATNVVRNKLAGLAPSAFPQEVRGAIESPEPPLLVDVRSKPEWDKVRLNTGEVIHLPFLRLRKKLGRLPRERDIVTFCWGGQRAYEAAIMLRQAGFGRVRFMDGSLFTWPFELEEDEADWR